MNSRKYTTIGALVGSTIGSIVPMLWGANQFSFSSLLLAAVGAIVGIYMGFKLSR